MKPPLIGITLDNIGNDRSSGAFEGRIAYSQRVAEAGGLPLFLPHLPERALEYCQLCDGLLLTGGADPHMERFGGTTSPAARPMDSLRLEFELALIENSRRRPELPVLGICLGMQLMALEAGGELDQSLLLSHGEETALRHVEDKKHEVEILEATSVLNFDAEVLERARPRVVSHHRQAIREPGRLRVVARSDDGILEAIDDPERRYYLGVQWHPERNPEPADALLNERLIADFVERCAERSA